MELETSEALEKELNNRIRELQESLRCAMEKAQDASEAKSRFLSNVSHDIRTPLTAIMGLVDIAVEHIDERDRVKECFDKVQLSSHHLLNLVNDVLDMSKIESGQINCAASRSTCMSSWKRSGPSCVRKPIRSI